MSSDDKRLDSVLAQLDDLKLQLKAAQDDAEQARYDNVESINFESRMLRLLEYRLERIESGR